MAEYNTDNPAANFPHLNKDGTEHTDIVQELKTHAFQVDGDAPDRAEAGKTPLDLEGEFAKLPHWRQQITIRALVIGLGLGVLFSIVTMKLNLQSGVIPGFGLAACMIGFVAIKLFTQALAKLGWGSGEYHMQETTIIQTMSNSVVDLAFSGGFASFLMSMSPTFYANFEGAIGINQADAKEPTLGRIMPYQVCIAFIGIFVVLQIKKALIIDYRLPYPSSRAAGAFIKTLHADKQQVHVKQQMKTLGKFFCIAFLWDLFEWFFSGNPDTCTGGWSNFPTFGVHALADSWNFNFALTYVGIGMLCPPIINWSMMLGAVVLNGIALPIAKHKAGDWYDASLPARSINGQYGYAVFWSLAFFLAEGAYTLLKLMGVTVFDICRRIKAHRAGQDVSAARTGFVGRVITGSPVPETEEDRMLSEYVFVTKGFSPYWGTAGYLVFLAIGTAVIPQIYPPAKWCLVSFILGPLFGVINAYGAGLTDWNIAGIWGILGIFVLGAWAGNGDNAAVIGILAASGIFGGATNAAASIMGDFKTGYFTLTSPKAMLVTQLIGECFGVVVAPLVFQLYYKGGYRLGEQGSTYSVPFATADLGAAVVAISGGSALPKNCLWISAIFFFVGIGICLFRDIGPERVANWSPSPLAMGIPGLVGAWVAIDMCIGSAIGSYWAWQAGGAASAMMKVIPVATGLIVGEGVWAVPQAILNFAGATPPVCMQFFQSSAVTSDISAVGASSWPLG